MARSGFELKLATLRDRMCDTSDDQNLFCDTTLKTKGSGPEAAVVLYSFLMSLLACSLGTFTHGCCEWKADTAGECTLTVSPDHFPGAVAVHKG
jgi:hypothetical protein